MFSHVLLPLLACLSSAQLPVPGTTGLVPGPAAEAQWYQQQLSQMALTVGRQKRSPTVPGTTIFAAESAAYEPPWFSGINNSFLKLLCLQKESRSHFHCMPTIHAVP